MSAIMPPKLKQRIDADTVVVDTPFGRVLSMTVKEHMDQNGKVAFREMVGLQVEQTGRYPLFTATYAVRID